MPPPRRSSRPQAKPESREPLVPSADMRRATRVPPSAVIPAKAGIQYPPGRMATRRQKLQPWRGAFAAPLRLGLNRSGLLVPGLRLRRNRDDILRVGFTAEVRLRRSCAPPYPRVFPDEAVGRRSGIGEARWVWWCSGALSRGPRLSDPGSRFACPGGRGERCASGRVRGEVVRGELPLWERMGPGARPRLGRGDGRGDEWPCHSLRLSSRRVRHSRTAQTGLFLAAVHGGFTKA